MAIPGAKKVTFILLNLILPSVLVRNDKTSSLKEESFGTDSLTSPPAADRTRASIYSTALTVTEKTGTGWLFNSR